MALSAKETLIYFGYTYALNLTHQGASVIIEKSSTTFHTMVEEKHQCQQKLVHLQHQNPSKGKKLYTWVKNQSAQIHQRKCVHNAHNVQSNIGLGEQDV
jgi:hypothetical protein